MTPIVAVGPGFGPGLLTSASTKRPGIVTNMDVTPTILAFLGVPIPPEVAGRPMSRLPGTEGLARLLGQEARIASNALWQQPVMRFLTVALDIIFLLCAVFVLWGDLPGAKLLQGLMLFVAGLPLALLLVPVGGETTNPVPWLVALSLTLTALLLVTARRRLWPLSLLVGSTVGLVVLDQFCGATLAQCSLLSYSPVAGSRFYGIGNEYMGVLIGAGTIGAGLAYTKWHGRRWLAPAVISAFLVLIVILGAPGLGANVGGTIAAVVGFGVAALTLGGKKVCARTLLLIGGMALGSLLLLALIDSLRPSVAQTHLGRLVGALSEGGVAPLWQMIERKMAMNFKLVRFSGWSRVALFALLSLAITALFPPRRRACFAARYPYLARAILASLAGAAAAFIFNDSGIVAAGTLLIFPATAWFYLLLEGEPEGTGR